MKLYYLNSLAKSNGDLVSISDKQHRIASYFIWNKSDGKFLKFSKLIGLAQDYLTEKKILQSDYLDCNMSIPIFSERARDTILKNLSKSIEFQEISILSEKKELKFYAGKCLNYYNIVNKDKSKYRLLTDGSKILSEPVFNLEIEHNFSLARDIENPQIIVASEIFRDVCMKNFLQIGFSKAPQE